MRLPVSRTVLLIATALCLIAQGAVALPECQCLERKATPPCHQPGPPERGTCCSGDGEMPAPGSCPSAMQLGCCASDAPPAIATITIAVVDHAGEQALAGNVPSLGIRSGAPAAIPARPRPPAPPGIPAWLLNSTLRN